MNHITAIKKLIKSISKSGNNHAIIIEGPPGWGKTTAVESALTSVKVQFAHLGAYSTPLNLFNFIYDNQDKFIVIDDTAGLFVDSASMAILKSATWPQAGKRTVRWGSTSSKAYASVFEFKGKFIMVCNSFPRTADGDAIKSRSFVRPIHISAEEAKNLLAEAAKDRSWFKRTQVAGLVADFLIERMDEKMVSKISYRTLQMGYELAKDHPENWQDLLLPALPKTEIDPVSLVKRLARQNLKVKEQFKIFEDETGLKRRTFFNYRNQLGIK